MDEVAVQPRLCPFCKEVIHPEAVKCKHCGSFIGRGAQPEQFERLKQMTAAVRSSRRTQPLELRRTAPDMAVVVTSPPFSLEEVCGPPEITTLDLGVYTIVFEDAYCCQPFETIGPDGQPAVDYFCYWKMIREPQYIWHEPGPIRREVIGGRVTPVE